jgi:hypothetical protein
VRRGPSIGNEYRTPTEKEEEEEKEEEQEKEKEDGVPNYYFIK